MQRRNFIAALTGLVALPLIGKAGKTEPQSPSGAYVLTHKESRSGLRRTDARIILDDSDGERVLIDWMRRHPAHVRKIANG